MMKPIEHFLIPDTQVKPDVPTNHLVAAANYIVEKQPDVIVHIGDHFDLPSLSAYDRGTKKAEGRRLNEDIEAGIQALRDFNAPIDAYNKGRRKKYKPRRVFCLGNHEQRLARHWNAHPELAGVLSYDVFQLEQLGWEVHDFNKPVCINGVTYSHYFENPNTGKPWGGKAHTKLNNIGYSFTMGHVQGKDQAEKALSNGQVLRGLVAGSFYQHDEEYKGHQGNHHWRGCIYKHEVRDGNYDLMELSLNYLLDKWS